MAVVNVNLNNMLNVKDSRWLQLEVCREFQRSKCSRSDSECKFAHPPANVEVQNGRVIACYDSIKGRCNREKPPCKYFHPPQHLKDQLLINGRNHLALKNALMLQMGMAPGQSVIPGQIPTIMRSTISNSNPCYMDCNLDYNNQHYVGLRVLAGEMSPSASPYLAGMPQLSGAYSPYVSASPMLQVVSPEAAVTSQLSVVPAAGYGAPATKLQRSDRIEAYPGMMPYKRTAGDKTAGMAAVYQQNPNASAAAAAAAAAYQAQALMQLQQPYVPVSCEYTGAAISSTCSSGLVTTSTSSSSASNASSSITTNTTTISTPTTVTSTISSSSTTVSSSLTSSTLSLTSSSSSTGLTTSKSGLHPNPSIATLTLNVTNGGASYDTTALTSLNSFNSKRNESDGVDSDGSKYEVSEDGLGGSQVINTSSATAVGIKRPRSPLHHPAPSSTPALSTAQVPILYTSTPSSLHFPALQSQTALAYTGVSLNKQPSGSNSVAIPAANAAAAAAAAASPIPQLSAVQQYQQYINSYASLVGAQSAQSALVNSYNNPFANNALLNSGALGFHLQGLPAIPSVASAAAAAAGQPPTAQQLATLQGLQAWNPSLTAAAQPNVGFLSGTHPLGLYAAAAAAAQGASLNSMATSFNQQMLPPYMSLAVPNNPAAAAAAVGGIGALRGVHAGVTNVPNVGVTPAAAAAAAAAAMAGGLQPYKKMRTI